MNKYFPGDEEASLWYKWENKNKEELVKAVSDYLLDLTGDAEAYAILEALKKQLGMKYEIPNAYIPKDLVDYGAPKNEWIKA